MSNNSLKKSTMFLNKDTFLIRSLACFLFLFPVSTIGFAGAESSGGLEHDLQAIGAAWFLNFPDHPHEKIRVCVIDAPSRLARDRIDHPTLVKWAFSNWSSYLLEKHTLDDASTPWDARQLVTKIEVSPSCQGGEDLRVYFGSSDADVEKAKLHYHDPIAMAERMSYDTTSGWGKGLIWIEPEMTEELDLRGILLHEIGHVLGCEHVSGTIMDGDLARYLPPGSMSSEDLRARTLTHIDGSKELYVCKFCSGTYTSGSHPIPSAFKALLKRDPVGAASVVFQKTAATPMPMGVLALSDATGTTSFRILTWMKNASFSDSNPSIFKVQNAYMTWGAPVFSTSFGGNLTSETGQNLEIVLNQNVGNALSITVVDRTRGTSTEIFSTDFFQN
jgi:hypothetical protein